MITCQITIAFVAGDTATVRVIGPYLCRCRRRHQLETQNPAGFLEDGLKSRQAGLEGGWFLGPIVVLDGNRWPTPPEGTVGVDPRLSLAAVVADPFEGSVAVPGGHVLRLVIVEFSLEGSIGLRLREAVRAGHDAPRRRFVVVIVDGPAILADKGRWFAGFIVVVVVVVLALG